MNNDSIKVVGFDSAWKDKPDAPGAICAVHLEGNRVKDFIAPTLAGFGRAREQIQSFCTGCGVNLIGFDQPTIVPNKTGCRPVERAVASLISWVGGGVQPANRLRMGLFDEETPLWTFLRRLEAIDDPARARKERSGLFIIEVFPALALVSMNSAFYGRLSGPHYNPARRATFKLDQWKSVGQTVRSTVLNLGVEVVASWCADLVSINHPRKSDQDKLDSIICMLVALSWRRYPRDDMAVIGDLINGYMITPMSRLVRDRLTNTAKRLGVPLD